MTYTAEVRCNLLEVQRDFKAKVRLVFGGLDSVSVLLTRKKKTGSEYDPTNGLALLSVHVHDARGLFARGKPG